MITSVVVSLLVLAAPAAERVEIAGRGKPWLAETDDRTDADVTVRTEGLRSSYVIPHVCRSRTNALSRWTSLLEAAQGQPSS